jgi:hypothetical protein
MAFAATAGICTSIADARLRDQWVVGYGQGVLEYSNYLDNDDLSKIIISDASEAYSGGTVEIFISIDGTSPKKYSIVKFLVDGDLIEMSSNDGGTIATDCHVCASNFDALWASLRRGRELIIQFDGKTAKFSLKGSTKALPKSPPIADFYR